MARVASPFFLRNMTVLACFLELLFDIVFVFVDKTLYILQDVVHVDFKNHATDFALGWTFPVVLYMFVQLYDMLYTFILFLRP